jgi:predicted  nucleic acid-binding Zn-ribbon protein
MADLAERLSQELDPLRKVRDELRVQLHLGRAEVKERWEKLEKDWSHVEGKLKVLREESKGELEGVAEAGRNLAQEIRKGYEHLKSLL